MAVYNDSFMNNATSILDLITGVGTAMGQPFLLGNLLLLAFFLIFLILALRNDFLEVFMVDAFLTTIIAILFYVAGMVGATTIIVPAVGFFIVIIFKLMG